jgi:hypothetical protein
MTVFSTVNTLTQIFFAARRRVRAADGGAARLHGDARNLPSARAPHEHAVQTTCFKRFCAMARTARDARRGSPRTRAPWSRTGAGARRPA